MSITKSWNWIKNDEDKWLTPCNEIYYLKERWTREYLNNFLDLGSGLGRHSIYMAKNGFDVTAIDLSVYGFNYLKEWSNRETLKINAVVGDMLNLPFDDNTFDSSISYQVIYHTDTKGLKKSLNEIKRVLKPKGELFVTMISKKSSSFTSLLNNKKLDENTIIISNKKTEEEVPHTYVDIEDIKKLFKKWTFIAPPREVYDYDIKKSDYLNVHWHLLIKNI